MVELQDQLAPLERLRSRFDDAGMLKATMELIGLAGGPVRPPRVDLSTEEREQVACELKHLGILDA